MPDWRHQSASPAGAIPAALLHRASSLAQWKSCPQRESPHHSHSPLLGTEIPLGCLVRVTPQFLGESARLPDHHFESDPA